MNKYIKVSILSDGKADHLGLPLYEHLLLPMGSFSVGSRGRAVQKYQSMSNPLTAQMAQSLYAPDWKLEFYVEYQGEYIPISNEEFHRLENILT